MQINQGKNRQLLFLGEKLQHQPINYLFNPSSKLFISPTTSSKFKQQSWELHIEKSNVVEAEIRWILQHAVILGLSDNRNDEIGNLFQIMFLDSWIADEFHIDHKETRHVGIYVLTLLQQISEKDNRTKQFLCYELQWKLK